MKLESVKYETEKSSPKQDYFPGSLVRRGDEWRGGDFGCVLPNLVPGSLTFKFSEGCLEIVQ